MINRVIEFHEKFGFAPQGKPGFVPEKEMQNRLNFQLEELLETAHASGFYFSNETERFERSLSFKPAPTPNRSLSQTLDGLVDQMYVLLGTAHIMGFFSLSPEALPEPQCILRRTVFEAAFDRVHAANMKKVRVEDVWKVQKPAGWTSPYLEDLL